ncbi:retention module-containing protein [Photobacterium aphoticum]|nr:retention module-containing protein [Photobacterium aphoticum]
MVSSNNSKVIDVSVKDGVVFVIKENGEVKAVKSDYQMQPEDLILSNAETDFSLLQNGVPYTVNSSCPTCVAVNEKEPKVVALDNNVTFSEHNSADALFDEEDVAAIHEAILAGQDPTVILAATAAGVENNGAASQGFVVVDYNNDSLLASAGYDTTNTLDHSLLAVDLRAASSEPFTANLNRDPDAKPAFESVVEGGHTVHGHLSASDPDGDKLTYSLVESTPPAGLTFNADGSYQFDPSHAAYDSLKEGETLELTIPFQVSDGRGGSTTETLTITIEGTNDGAVIRPHQPGSDTGSVQEDATLTAGGKLDITDVDHGEAVFQPQTDIQDGQWGTFSIDAKGNWTYTLNNDHPDVQALDVDSDPVVRTITVTSADGTTHDIVITITGTEDAPEVSGSFTGSVTEGDLGHIATATGTIGISDVDNGDDPVFTNTTVQGQYGSLELVDGKWTYTLDQSKVQQLDEGDVVKDTITLTASDGTKQDIVIDIIGTEDAPEVSGSFTGSVTEGDLGHIATATGTIGITDIDNGDDPVFANTTMQGQYGSLELVDGKWTYTLDQSKVQQLDEGDVVKDTITLTASDGTKQDIVIDITGTEDAPEVSGSFTGSVTEGDLTEVATTSGTIGISDVDNGDDPVFTNITVQGQYGSLELVDGKWAYTLDQSKVQQLDEGDVVKDTITLTASDGTKQDIVIDITGTEDAPVVSGSFTGSVTEGDLTEVATTSGTIGISDVDNGDDPVFANTTVQGQYGSLELVDGKWTYTLDQSKVQQLDEGDVVKDTITLTASDGTKQDIVIDITGTEDAPEVSGLFTGSVTEGNIGEVEIATGIIGITDVDNGDDPVFANTTVQGQYGSLELVDGKWTYTLDQSKVQQLDEGDVVKDTITLTASDGTKQDIVIDITGTEDASVVSGSFTGSVTEGDLTDVATTSGTIAISDVDNGDDPVFANTTIQGQYGSLELVDGKWTYTLDQSKVQQLDEGDVVKDTITLTASDGTKQDIVIDITGTEDAPEVSGSFTGSVSEGDLTDVATATGTIGITDVDNGDDPVFANTTVQGQYGSFELVDGKWTYTLDQSKVQQLDEGDVVKDTITLTASDGTKQDIVIDITGTEDSPVVTGSFTGSVTEGDLNDVATASGTIAISDVDNGDDPVFANTTIQGQYGSLELVDGKWTYTLDQSKVQQLDEGDVVKDTITLTASDGTKQDIVIDITGTEDAPEVSGSFTGLVTEGNIGDPDSATTAGTIGISDVDNGDDPVFANTTVQGQYGSLELVDGKWTYTLDQSKVQQLDEGDVVKDTITLTASDGTKQAIVIDITGTEDAPEVSGSFTGSVTEGNIGDPDSAKTTATGTISISDVDNGDDPVFANITVQGQYGSLELVDGKWTYTLDQSKVQQLDEGDVVKDTITLTASDGTQQDIVIDITGTEDASVVSGSFTGAVTEGDLTEVATATGTIGITDIDNGDDPVFANTTVQGQYGSLELVDGKWTYTLDQSKVQQLDEGDMVKDTITLTASDGTKQDIVIDITGTEDAPVVTGLFTGLVTEGNVGDPDSAKTTATGTIGITDVDNGDDPVFANTKVQGQYGSLELVDGKWTYTLDQSKVQQLDEGDVVKDTITLTASDGTKQDIVIDITGTEDAPEVSGSFTGSVTEGNIGDPDSETTTATGTIAISDIDNGDDPVFANTTIQGQYGSLELVDGKWTYTLDQSKVQQLDEGDVVKDTITLTASDGTKQDIVIDITGTEDAPVVTGLFTGSVTEGDLTEVATATGTIGISDVDNGDDPVFANTTVQGQYGSLELVDGKWTYTLDQSKVQQLDEGDVVTDTITLTASDGTKQNIVIDITGTEDAPEVSGSFTGSVTEGNIGDPDSETTTATGTIGITDVDNGDDPVFANTTVQGQYGSLELVDGKWTYTLDQSKVQQLDEGDVVKDTITLTASDGTKQDIVIDITGTEDVPEVSGSFTGSVTEGNIGDPDSATTTATGTIGITDVDNGDDPVFANTTVQGQYGSLELVDGKWTYTLDQSKVQQLDEGDVVKDTITLTASDGTKQDIVIDITGTEDAPEVSGSFTGSVTEGNIGDPDSETTIATGTIAISDIDNGDDPVFANTTVQGQYGSLELVDGKWTYTLDQSKVQQLDEGDVVKDTITLTASDGTKQDIVIDITGTEDAPEVSGSFTGSVIEGNIGDTEIATGTISISDVDNGDDPVFTNTTIQGQYGSLELVDGKWTYTLDQSKVQQLDEGDVVKDTITLTASDGTKQNIVIDITGTEDAPEVSGSFTGAVTEGDLGHIATATGTISITDVDNGDDPVFANITVQGQYGSLELVDGKWTYTLDQSKVQHLNEGEALKETIMLTASDGTTQDIVIDIAGSADAPEFISGNNDQHGLDANGQADADSYQFSVEKGADGVVGKVSAFDVDQNNPVTYHLTSHTDLFEINSLTGEIRVKDGVVLDEHKLGDYILNVEAHDPFGGKDTAQVEVSVNGLNDAYAELNEFQLGSEHGAHIEGSLEGNAGPGAGEAYQFSADQNLEGFTSGGQPVTFEVSADNGTLIGYIGSGADRVTVLEATIDSQTGHYTVDLHAPLDHSGQGEDKLDLTVNVEVQMGDHVENAHLQLGVVDSVPDAGGAHHEINDVEPQNNTVVIALDASGSMKDIVLDADGHPISRWDLAKDSIKTMFEKYDELGEVKFKIAMHGGYPQGMVSGWITSVEDIDAFFAKVEPSGWTPYSEAVDEVNQILSDPDSQAQFESSDTQLYFISDGKPSDFNNWTDQNDPFYIDARKSLMKWSSADDFGSEQRYQDLLDGVVKPTAAEERIILNNAMESSIASSGQDVDNIWAVGIGNNASLEHLESVATDKGSAIVVVDDSQIEDLLGQTVSGQVQGSLMNGQGGDAQWIESVTVDGCRYEYDRATGTVMKIDEKGVESKLSDHALAQIDTVHGQLTINFENGHYNYTTSDVSGMKQENIGVTIVDGDGDKVDSSITIDIVDRSTSADVTSETAETQENGSSVHIAPAESLNDEDADVSEAHAESDPQEAFSVESHQTEDTVLDSHVVMGTDGDDLLSAGIGYDILTGGEGSDTFIWHASDLNVTEQPDVVTDFILDVDTLDLSDLLPDSENADNSPDMEALLGHLAAEFNEAGNVDLTVTTESGAEQHIELANIDASGLGLESGAASNDIVNQLFQHNAFKVD